MSTNLLANIKVHFRAFYEAKNIRISFNFAQIKTDQQQLDWFKTKKPKTDFLTGGLQSAKTGSAGGIFRSREQTTTSQSL